MAFVSISGLGVDTTAMPTDEQVIACLAAGAARERCGMPSYCFSTSLDPRSWFRGLWPQCAPYTQEELSVMTGAQAVVACKDAPDPAACEAGLIAAAARAEAAAKSTDPEGTCEYNASQQHPTLSSVLGPAAVCKLYAGDYTLYIVSAVVVLGFLFVNRKGRY